MADSLPTTGDILAGKYRVERMLGSGGMGCVVVATHVAFDDRVAIKFLLPHLAGNRELVERFLREGRSARKIRSEHVVQVTDIGTLESGAPYMVMEYLEGDDLSKVVLRGGPLPVAVAIEYLLQASEALAEAHAAGIVHRDLKPANLFLTQRRDGSARIKVLDFGISKLTAEGPLGRDSSLTRTQGMMGSPLYMSPEQLQSARDVDARSDLWSLGVILFELLTGTQPFLAEDLPRLCVKILIEPPVPASSLRADLPRELVAVIERCLEKDRARRFANVGELAVALLPFASPAARTSIERVARIAGVSTAPSRSLPQARPAFREPPETVLRTTAGTSAEVASPTVARASRGLLPFALAAGTLVSIAGAGALFALRGRAPDAHTPATTQEQKIATPEQKIATPEQKIATPEQKIATPEQKIATPEQKTGSSAPTAAPPIRPLPSTLAPKGLAKPPASAKASSAAPVKVSAPKTDDPVL